VDALVHPWLQPMLGNPFFSVRELPTRCNWTSWFDNTQKRLDVVRDVRAQNSRPAPPRPAPCAVHGSVTMPSTREDGQRSGCGRWLGASLLCITPLRAHLLLMHVARFVLPMPPEALQIDRRKRDVTALLVERQLRRVAARQRSCRSSALRCVRVPVCVRAHVLAIARAICVRAYALRVRACASHVRVLWARACCVVCARAGNWTGRRSWRSEQATVPPRRPLPPASPGHRDTTTACKDGRTCCCARVGVESLALNRQACCMSAVRCTRVV
jgi:hypothetical protein